MRIVVDPDKEEVDEDEELIAFRIGIFKDEDFEGFDTDFHFMVRRDDMWMEKRGSTEVRFCEFTEDTWIGTDCVRYNGPIIFLAKKI